jgi:hypothetical protein
MLIAFDEWYNYMPLVNFSFFQLKLGLSVPALFQLPCVIVLHDYVKLIDESVHSLTSEKNTFHRFFADQYHDFVDGQLIN